MHGTFNGVPIDNVFAMKIDAGITVLRVLGPPGPGLEQQFMLKSRATVKVSMYEFQGKVTRYDPAVPAGVYEVTIKGKNRLNTLWRYNARTLRPPRARRSARTAGGRFWKKNANRASLMSPKLISCGSSAALFIGEAIYAKNI